TLVPPGGGGLKGVRLGACAARGSWLAAFPRQASCLPVRDGLPRKHRAQHHWGEGRGDRARQLITPTRYHYPIGRHEGRSIPQKNGSRIGSRTFSPRAKRSAWSKLAGAYKLHAGCSALKQ